MDSEHAASEAVHRLEDLTWVELADWFRRDPRLILPVGSCIQHGEGLPLGTDSRIAEHLAADVGRRTGILLAPLLTFGVATEEELGYAGTAGLERKTLHRVLNELVQSWERQGLREITLLTTNGNTRNIQALAMVIGETARIRSVDTRAIDVSHLVDPVDYPVAWYETALLLYLEPDLVRNANDGSPLDGVTASKGKQLYDYLVDSIVGRLGALDP